MDQTQVLALRLDWLCLLKDYMSSSLHALWFDLLHHKLCLLITIVLWRLFKCEELAESLYFILSVIKVECLRRTRL